MRATDMLFNKRPLTYVLTYLLTYATNIHDNFADRCWCILEIRFVMMK